MIKDGRWYLVNCVWVSKYAQIDPTWEIIRWGVPTAFSDPYGNETWVRPSGMSLRIDNCTFGEFYELDNVIQLLRCTKMAGVDYGKNKDVAS